MIEGAARLDLCYAKDRDADVDFNVVMTADEHLIEVQGTAERAPFSRETVNRMLDLAAQGIAYLIRYQRKALM